MSHRSFISCRGLAAMLGIVAGVALVPGRLMAQAGPAASPLHLVPPSAVEVVHVRIADLAKSKAFRLLPPDGQKAILTRLSHGVAPDLVETLTLVSLQQEVASVIDLFNRGTPRPDMKERWEDKKPPLDEPIEKKESRAGSAGTLFVGKVDDGHRPQPPSRLLVILTTREDLDPGDLLVLRPDHVFKTKGKTILRARGLYFHLRNGRTLIASDQREAVEKQLGQAAPAAFTGPLAPALERAAAGRATVTVGWAYNDSALEHLARKLEAPYRSPAERGLLRTLAPLLKAQPGVLAVDLNDGKAEAELHYAGAAAAKKGALAAGDALALLRLFGLGALENEFAGPGMPLDHAGMEQTALFKVLHADLAAALQGAQLETAGSTVRIAARLPADLGTLRARAKAAAKDLSKDERYLAIRRTAVSQTNLKQIVLAMHNYHDAIKGLPPQAICDPDGKPLLSWRVAILPFIEQGELFRQFRLNEAWDSPHNLKLLEKMPTTYAVPGIKTKEPHATFYQGFVGSGAGMELRPRRGAVMNAEALILPRDFPDGTANTLLVVEAADAVPWTKPADVSFDPKGALPKLGGLFAPGFNAGFADGSVRFFARPPVDMVLRALITRNGGELVDLPDDLPPPR